MTTPLESHSAPSCYLLEYSIGPGGTPLGDVYAAGDLASLKEMFEKDGGYGYQPFLDYHLMLCGAVLHLWVVQRGTIVGGFDVRPYLRTGDPGWDRTLARVIELQERDKADERAEEIWEDVGTVIEDADWEAARTLPLLGKVFELHDQITAASDAAEDAEAQLEVIREGDEDLPSTGPLLKLDWHTVAELAPSLQSPVLASGWLEVTWADDPIWVEDSYICRGLHYDSSSGISLHFGWNDLENGDAYPEEGESHPA
jgi:hypothetical protein